MPTKSFKTVTKLKKKKTPATIPLPASPSPSPSPDPPPVKKGFTQVKGPDRIKTTLFMANRLYARSKERARDMGLSFNAWMAMAAYHELGRPSELTLSELAQLKATPHVPDPPSSPEDQMARAVARFGEGYTYQDEDTGQAWFASWDQIEKYNDALGQHSDGDFRTLGRALGFSPEVARAADIATQLPIFEEYMTAKYGPVKG